MLRREGTCEWDGCEHRDAQYRIELSFVRLDGRREALACRKHVALVAKALAEEMRQWVTQGIADSELAFDELEAPREREQDRREERQRQEEAEGA